MAALMTARYQPDDILSVEQAAEYLKVSESTVRAHCKLDQGEPDRLPNFRMGERAGAIKIPFWALVNWVAQRAGCSMPPASFDKLRMTTSGKAKRRMMKAQSRRLSRTRR